MPPSPSSAMLTALAVAVIARPIETPVSSMAAPKGARLIIVQRGIDFLITPTAGAAPAAHADEAVQVGAHARIDRVLLHARSTKGAQHEDR
jgi:hypothetical protein